MLIERVVGEVGEPQIGPERTAVVGQLEALVDVDVGPVVVALLLVGHAVVDPRELLVVGQVDAQRQRELVVLVRLEIDAGLAHGQELLQVLVELRIGHVRHLVVVGDRADAAALRRPPVDRPGSIADRLGAASRPATLAA